MKNTPKKPINLKKVKYEKIDWNKLSTQEVIKKMRTLQMDMGRTDAVKLVHKYR